MIKHIVMWKLKDAAEGKTKSENALIIKKLLEELPNKIPQLEKAEVGIGFLNAESDAVSDVVLTAECQTEEDLQAYAVHPDHKKAVNFISKVVAERRVVDYIHE